MRENAKTSVEIDGDLLSEAMNLTGLSTQQAVVENALRGLIQTEKQRVAIKNLAGLGWDGELDAMREGRDFR
jgi:Arc/MetJ family transcription regulator